MMKGRHTCRRSRDGGTAICFAYSACRIRIHVAVSVKLTSFDLSCLCLSLSVRAVPERQVCTPSRCGELVFDRPMEFIVVGASALDAGCRLLNGREFNRFVATAPRSRTEKLSGEKLRCTTVLNSRASSDSDVSKRGRKTVGKATIRDNDAVSQDIPAAVHEPEEPTNGRLPDGKKRALSTEILHFKGEFDPYEATNTPLYQTATFKQPSAIDNGPYDYTRSGNPTRDTLEKLLAKIEGAQRAFVFGTGMSALAATTRLVEAGQEIVAGDDIYGGTDRLLSRVVPRSGVKVTRVDTSDLEAVRAAVGPATRLVVIESPTNPRIQISDIRAIADIAHANGALLLVDNSIQSPVHSQPLKLGADIVMHSATKFIAGHSDVMAGVLAVNDRSLAEQIYFLQNAEGTGLAPFDCWLCIRGVKTMPLRVERQQANAQKIAEFLANQPRITRVNYAGLEGHPGRDLHFSQSKGAGSVLSFATGSLSVSRHIVEKTQLAAIAVSFGSVSTTISLPCFMSHASIPAEVRKQRGLMEDLIRISVGIEDVDDLIADLQQAIDSAPPT